MFDNKPRTLIELPQDISMILYKLEHDTMFHTLDVDAVLSFLLSCFSNNCDTQLIQSDEIGHYVVTECAEHFMSSVGVPDDYVVNELCRLVYLLTIQIRNLYNSLGFFNFEDFNYEFHNLIRMNTQGASTCLLILRKG